MKILFLGDLVGKPGFTAAVKKVPALRKELSLDAVVVNAENAADGSGLTPRQFQRLTDAGVDAITMGDHIYKNKDIIEVLAKSSRIVKPANYPLDSPGRCWTIVDTEAGPLVVISIMGRVFMRPVDCPFDALDRVLAEVSADDRFQGTATGGPPPILVDVHAEATSDKQVLGRYLDGKVTAVLGTHTHVPTADATVLPGGTAFQCDVGMCGPYESIIGRDISRVMSTSRTFEPTHFYVATQDVRLCGAIVESNPQGLATSIVRFEQKIK
ncbi:hypothetical protein Pla22_49230 [Rubripirellula amarantea]|uniref:Metallophosphoesterase n=1 Tax=Rubripirellula amarantea TaxID=2527999 RepID=A0A5C5WIS1_9BACT|nr:TIGR00282 family metallophosphoesterase [Rubripirellula amarantea]TWT49722.1 hypothetical protein Pla22_49230 [Rubripirellula amarantea]